MYDTGKTALYGHGFLDGNVVVLGFGDGSVQVRAFESAVSGAHS